MILLGSQVVSEVMHRSPHPAVKAWGTGHKETGYPSACWPEPLPSQGLLRGLSPQPDAAVLTDDLAGSCIAVRTSDCDFWTAIIKEVVQRSEHRVIILECGRPRKETNDGNPD